MKREDMTGILKKLKTSKLGRLFGNTNMRWFECIFKEKLFGYKDKVTDLKLRSTIKFDEIIDFADKLCLEDSKMCDWNYGFHIVTKDRTYILYCQNQENLEKWASTFNFILKRAPKKLAVINSPNFSSIKEKINKTDNEYKAVKANEKIIPQKEEEVKVFKKKNKIPKKEEEIKVFQEKIIIKKEVIVFSNILAPENNIKSEVVLDDGDESIVITDRYNEKKQEKTETIVEQIKFEDKPKHTKKTIPQLESKNKLKLHIMNNKYDENIENIIFDADKSFDNLEKNDNFHKSAKKNARSASVIITDKNVPNNNVNSKLKILLNKEKDEKEKLSKVGIEDWNFYDKSGKVLGESSGYNPANVNRKEKPNLFLVESLHNEHINDNNVDQSVTNEKSILKDNNKSTISKYQTFQNNNNDKQTSLINDDDQNNIYAVKNEKKSKKEIFRSKTLLDHTMLFDQKNHKSTLVSSNVTQNLFVVEGKDHPVFHEKQVIKVEPIESNKINEKQNNVELEEINKFFDENKQNVQESKYNKQYTLDEIKKKPIIKSLTKMDVDFDDFDLHNQKKQVNNANKTERLIKKVELNNDYLNSTSKPLKNDISINQNILKKSNTQFISPAIVNPNLGNFDSNPDFTNNIIFNNNNEDKGVSIINFNVKKSENNMNSSFVEGLTDDWEKE